MALVRGKGTREKDDELLDNDVLHSYGDVSPADLSVPTTNLADWQGSRLGTVKGEANQRKEQKSLDYDRY